jgi:hypothetical protein
VCNYGNFALEPRPLFFVLHQTHVVFACLIDYSLENLLTILFTQVEKNINAGLINDVSVGVGVVLLGDGHTLDFSLGLFSSE